MSNIKVTKIAQNTFYAYFEVDLVLIRKRMRLQVEVQVVYLVGMLFGCVQNIQPSWHAIELCFCSLITWSGQADVSAK